MNDRVVITRDDNSIPQQAQRVYITGPHFGEGIYSSTTDPAKASTFSREKAEELIAEGKWRGCNPEIQPAPDMAK